MGKPIAAASVVAAKLTPTESPMIWVKSCNSLLVMDGARTRYYNMRQVVDRPRH